MKSTRDVIGLPVLAVSEADIVARVFSTVVNPDEGKVDFLLLEGDEWFLEKKCIAYSDIVAIGKNSVIVEKAADIQPVTLFEQALKLLREESKVLNSRVITRDGRLVGTVSEFYFNTASGEVTGCALIPRDSHKPAGIIPAAKIITFGRKYLVVAEDADTALEKEVEYDRGNGIGTSPPSPGIGLVTPPAAPTGELKATEPTAEKDPPEMFSEKQRRFLIGKRVNKTVIDADGNIVATEGTVITEDIINRAVRVDKYVDLTMHVK